MPIDPLDETLEVGQTGHVLEHHPALALLHNELTGNAVPRAEVEAVIGPAFSGVMATLTNFLYDATVTDDPIIFDTIIYDEGDWTSDGTIFTVPAGVTRVSISVYTTANTQTQYFVIEKNGTFVLDIPTSWGALYAVASNKADLNVNPGDTLQLVAPSAAGGTETIIQGRISIRRF